jgi:hypothetical protein
LNNACQETLKMIFEKTKGIWVRVISVAILSAGFAQVSFAGTIDTGYLIEADAHAASLDRIQSILARDEIANEFLAFGIDQSTIDARLEGMTAAELISLEGRIDESIAGGSALGTIGAVFLVLLVLEVLGVTDVFTGV